ncbi:MULTISPECIES: MarR family winged helix-turn-helix transcriptional regulator [Enterovibrio]|uniref:MarR family transcriptional regulator n=1 Tax=Enterovibrio norvegicus FF-454 TaxID=1185651 RepID=A0A1E5CEX8_9GAMM|nr:MarR family transcriptional regulator [Enterovibrio norvegicus]OEE64084.1 MarR family transcriptional regulator [Enterovibrio norvegicus FF-454]OEE80743.1 MarR family transcriptional regulator [Enterovibrio norvegicus FF-162]
MANAQAFILDDFLPYKLVKTAMHVSDALAKIYQKEFGISRSEWRVLASLGARDGVLSKDLAKETSMDKVKVSRILNRLEASGIVMRETLEKDQRAALIRLTQQGNELYQKIVPRVLDWERKVLDGLTGTQYHDLYAALDTLQHRTRELED